MIVEVYRGSGDRLALPVSEPLLSDSVLIDRGRAIMNANAHIKNEHTLDIIFQTGLMLGQLVELFDVSTAVPVRGKVTNIAISIAMSDGLNPRLSVDTSLTIEQPTL